MTPLLFAISIAGQLVATSPGSQSLDFRADWKFSKGEQPGAESPESDDSSWASLRLPHDWAIAGPFDPTQNGSTGKLPWRGIGWYRKAFTLDCDPNDRVYLDFDGVMAFPTVYINGQLAGEWDYGYTSFRIDATPYLHGVNLHHDHGPLGTAFFPRAMQRQLEIMREMGANAIRTSHNAPAPELLELCDQMGILVWDECFDKWNGTADRVDRKPSHEEHAKRHLRSMVMRDRNHPSVVVWSIGNEISADREGVTPERVAMMRDVTRTYDETRPVGLGCHIASQADTHILDSLDLAGWNYARRYARYRERFPDKPIVYCESASALSTRGFYEFPRSKTKTDYSDQYQLDSYDFNAAPWSDIADAEFKLMQDDPFVAGEFVWTGFDYLGEPTPFERQAKSSYFGIVDLCGLPKDRYYLYRSHWRPQTPTVHILPHWNWPARLGQTVPVFVYTNGDAAELFLNGKSLGVRKKGVLPKRPANLAAGRPASASSSQPDHAPQVAADDQDATCWRADRHGVDPWWQVDLGESQLLKCLILRFAQEAKYYGYVIQTSDGGSDWESVITQPSSREPRWGGPRTAVHDLDAHARFVRMEFTQVPRGGEASLCEFAAYSAPTESSYYAPTFAYRLRWEDVVYEPGELRAVAFKDGVEIGSANVRTAGAPAAIRLTPDRTQLVASGDDLCYVLVEVVDEHGTLCPLADNLIHFHVDGPGEIAAVGNGNPLSVEPFKAEQRKAFFGKAMLIVRTQERSSGEIRIYATSEGLADAHANVDAENPNRSTDDTNVGTGLPAVGDAGFDGKPNHRLQAKVGRSDTRIRFTSEADKTVVEITSGFGIDKATIRRISDEWPSSILVRLQLRGLESFRAGAGALAVEWSVSSSGEKSSRVSLRQGREETQLTASSPYHTQVRSVGGNHRIPLEEGYFEVPLPAKLFERNPEEIKLQWIDFYRN